MTQPEPTLPAADLRAAPAPTPPSVAAAPPTTAAGWRSGRGRVVDGTTTALGVGAILVLVLAALVALATFFVDLSAAETVAGWAVDPATISRAAARGLDRTQTTLGVGYLVAFLVGSALMIIWLYRVYTGTRVDRSELRHAPGWVIGSWFVPVLNLWRPAQIVRDLWWAATPPSGRAPGIPGHRGTPWVMVLWWIAFLASSVLGSISNAVSRGAKTTADIASALQFDAGAALVSALGALLTATVLGGIYRKIQR